MAVHHDQTHVGAACRLLGVARWHGHAASMRGARLTRLTNTPATLGGEPDVSSHCPCRERPPTGRTSRPGGQRPGVRQSSRIASGGISSGAPCGRTMVCQPLACSLMAARSCVEGRLRPGGPADPDRARSACRTGTPRSRRCRCSCGSRRSRTPAGDAVGRISSHPRRPPAEPERPTEQSPRPTRRAAQGGGNKGAPGHKGSLSDASEVSCRVRQELAGRCGLDPEDAWRVPELWFPTPAATSRCCGPRRDSATGAAGHSQGTTDAPNRAADGPPNPHPSSSRSGARLRRLDKFVPGTDDQVMVPERVSVMLSC